MIAVVDVIVRKDKCWAIVDKLRRNYTEALVTVNPSTNSEDVLIITIRGELTAQQLVDIGMLIGFGS